MERKQNIEHQVNAALQSAKKNEPAELPYGFSDRVINKMHAKQNVRWIYNISPMLRVAAVFVIILINVFTLRIALSSQSTPVVPQYATIKDFVNEYQIIDGNDELLTTNNIHEQR